MPPDVDKTKAQQISEGAFQGPRNPFAFQAPQAAHDAVVNGTHNDRNGSEKHFKAAHSQVMGKKGSTSK
jgi:hypothetical protein